LILGSLCLLPLLGAPATAEVLRVPAFYVGFEDRAGRDFDYNDFGMRMEVEEERDGPDRLRRVMLRFEAACHLAGDVHDVHLRRIFPDRARFAFTLERSRPAQGTESPETPGADEGAGELDVVLFDTGHALPGDRVTLEVFLDDCVEVPVAEPLAGPESPDSLWSRYDPWLFNRVLGQERHVGESQPFRDEGFEVPYVLVVPARDWFTPDENVPVTTTYPLFREFHATRDPALARWFEVPLVGSGLAEGE